MASGCVTITNDNPLNHWLLKDGENAVSRCQRSVVSRDKIVEALEDPDLRARIIDGGLATVSPTRLGPSDGNDLSVCSSSTRRAAK